MNKRISELAVQAGDDWDHTLPSDREFLNKFAELIVKECCGAANEWYQKHNELHWDPAQHIRNHFGVE